MVIPFSRQLSPFTSFAIANLCRETAALSPTLARQWASILHSNGLITEATYESLFNLSNGCSYE